MLLFTPSEVKQRHATAERAIERTRDVLRDAAVQRCLGGTATNLLVVIDQLLYIPNERHGLLTKPRSVKHPNAIAVTALAPSETLTIDPALQAPFSRQIDQLRSWHRSITSEKDEAALDRAVEKVLDTQMGHAQGDTIDVTDRELAVVRRGITPFTVYSSKYQRTLDRGFHSRPIVAFNSNEVASPRIGGTGVHEMQHVMQSFGMKENRAVVNYDTRRSIDLRDELEAYYVQRIAEEALFYESTNQEYRGNEEILSAAARYVDQAREEVNANSKDPFAPRGHIEKILSEIDLDIVG
jgi:hypothetical protein